MPKRIVYIITKNQFDKIQPKCNCNCNKSIVWKEKYKYIGIPKYISGHNRKGKFLQEIESICIYCNNIYYIKQHTQNKLCPSCYKKKFDDKLPIIHCLDCNKVLHPRTKPKNKYRIPLCTKCNFLRQVNEKGHPAKGKIHSEETKIKISIKQYGHKCTEQQKIHLSIINTGKHHTEKTKKKISIGNKHKKTIRRIRVYDEMKKRQLISEKIKNMWEKTDFRFKMSGKNSNQWKGGISYYPYCEKFNEFKKEEIRDKYDRKCFLCGLDEKENITKTRKTMKLSVHHIDGDKEQGCNGKQWYLVPLCIHCHGKTTNKIDNNNINKCILDIFKYYDYHRIQDAWNWLCPL